MCTFYYRLTKDLEGYRFRVMIGFGLIISSFVIVQMNLLLSCRPFYHWWQISPDPGAFCHAAISPSLIWTGLSFNLITDFYLIMIPMPMLWKAAMPWPQKAGLITLFSCGLFVTMAAILRVVLLVSVIEFHPILHYICLTTRRILSMALNLPPPGLFARLSWQS